MRLTDEEIKAIPAMMATDTALNYARAVIVAYEAKLREQNGPIALPFAILDEEMKDLHRFHECASDGEGYDVPKERMKRLAEIGLLRRVTANIYEHTTFGLSVIDGDFTNPAPIPEGWQLVPAEPTTHMVNEGLCGCMDNDVTVCIWKKMLAAARSE